MCPHKCGGSCLNNVPGCEKKLVADSFPGDNKVANHGAQVS